MLNKKLSKFLVLGLTAVMLASCGDVTAKPGYENGENILGDINLKDTGSEINNMLSTIYDAMHDSSTLSTTTINVINEKLFETYYGTYTEIEAVVKANKDADYEAFVNNHKAYQELDEEGNRVTATAETKALEIARVKRSYNRIQNLISEKIVNTLTGSDYKDINGLFSEKLFALGVYKKLHKLDDTHVLWSDFVANHEFYEPILLLPNLELFDEDTNTWSDQNIIHISNNLGYYKDYIENDILPEIYSHMLSEYYLYRNEYSSLGGKYARKATYISLTPNSKDIYNTKHADLINYFARNNVLNGTTAEAADLEIVEEAWIGYNLSGAAKEVLNGAGFVYNASVEVSVDGLPALTDDETVAKFKETYKDIIVKDGSKDILPYYEGTLFGNIIEDFLEVNPFDIANSSKAKENKFSGNNSYSYYDGFVKEIQSLLQKTFVTEGWGLKSDGFSGLDSGVKDRLMTINVATDLKAPKEGETHSSNYLKYVEGTGNFYLLPEKRLPDDPTPFIFSTGTTRTIVQVEEAASVAKLSKKSSSPDKYSAEKAEEVAYEICNLLADNGTTKSNAMEFFLEESEILYHDDKILEYFKENYPNLFEE
jgi:hypothetical protein